MSSDQPLWSPSAPRRNGTLMHAFEQFVAGRINRSFVSYQDFHAWTVHNLDDFWGMLADFVNLKWQVPPTKAFVHGKTMRDATWFPESRLNFAANLLPTPSDDVVLICHREGLGRLELTGAELWNAVARCAVALKNSGVRPGDRVAGILANGPEAVIAMLATTSLGGVWSSCSPDFGQIGVYDRLSQIEPKVVFVTKNYQYNAKMVDAGATIFAAIERLKPEPRVIICDPFSREDDFAKICFANRDPEILPIEFASMSFQDPLYIMFSSGTTGLPKCIVHGVGGTLLQHKKELMLHSDIKKDDRLLFFTTCGWMMWNWMVSALGCGASVVTFDGSPTYPNHEKLWDIVRDDRVTHFGTSPKFIGSCMSSTDGSPSPIKNGPQSDLRCVLSTGSPLLPAHFEWICENLPNVHLASISGGTDIISCFMLGNPALPVYTSEIQCAGLGMAIEAWDENGVPVRNRKAELVCVEPFVSMPIGFWNDPTGEKYRKAYFEYYDHKSVWRHGDFVEITKHGGIIVYGRSDATLNPGGVRIGTAELYRAVESVDYVSDSIAVGQNWNGDVRILLFVKLKAGVTWTEDFSKQIKTKIRSELTPRHVPALVLMVPDIPYTRSGKKVEIAATQVVHGEPVPNKGALMNPESLEHFEELRALYK